MHISIIMKYLIVKSNKIQLNRKVLFGPRGGFPDTASIALTYVDASGQKSSRPFDNYWLI